MFGKDGCENCLEILLWLIETIKMKFEEKEKENPKKIKIIKRQKLKIKRIQRKKILNV